jgi:hypothetical protein
MSSKNIVMTVDHENGIKNITLSSGDVMETVSLSDEGCPFLDDKGADIILDFDKDGKLINIQLMGF